MRGNLVIGNPGSGKSFALINSFIRQHIAKGFSACIYDFKFPTLSTLTYNVLLRNIGSYKVQPQFCVLNFDDPRHSHRCNPIAPDLLNDITDAYESAFVTLVGMNRTWASRSGDFFVESAVTFFAAIIWFLRVYKDGEYCTLPHALELLNKGYTELFPILMAEPTLTNYMTPFSSALKSGVFEQLEGQVASVRIPLARLISPTLY